MVVIIVKGMNLPAPSGKTTLPSRCNRHSLAGQHRFTGLSQTMDNFT